MMSQRIDMSASVFIKAARRLFSAALLGALSVSGASAQQTEAETAALSERPLTQTEAERRLAECSLPAPTGQAYMGDQAVAITRFPEFRFIELLTFDKGYTLGDQTKVFVHPMLPFGGIGPADICGEALFAPLSGGAVEQLSLAVMLRSGLDLDESYPSSRTQISDNSQLKTSGSNDYLVLPLPRSDLLDAVEPVFETLKSISDVDFIDWSGHTFWMRNVLFLPLKEIEAVDE